MMITKKANLIRVLKNINFTKNEPISVVHFLTNRCNARCPFCFIDFDNPKTFQGELTIDQLLFNRPFPGYSQYRMPIKNMYMFGSSTHPGGGVSSCCGVNAAREILIDLKKPNTVPEDDCYDE